ncbi:MAG: nuclease [Methanobacterium sp.]|nr:nuclease [Methanobacterium sp.]
MAEEIDYQPLELLAELKAKAEAEPVPAELPECLPINAIRRVPELFQPRGEREDEHHLGELVRAIGIHGMLDPVEVIQIGQDAYLVDGHHRVTAYGMAKVAEPVPVVYFMGTIEEAVLKAGQANNKAKLPMTTRERMDYAWRLVLMDKYSKRQIVEAAGTSDRQVANMRQAMGKLGKGATSFTHWRAAQRAADDKDGHQMTPEQRADWVEQRAGELADKLARTFSNKLSENIEITARALERYFGRRLGEIAGEMGFYPRDCDEEDDF